MKKIFRALAIAFAPLAAACTVFAGCKSCKGKAVTMPETTDFMRDIEVAPTQKALYEEYTKAAYDEYKAVADKHIVDGDVDTLNEEVVAAASKAAAKLFAYACYNERYLDRYVYFSDQDANTDLGTSGKARARKQEQYLRVNESETTCGYRYHYTLKKVVEDEGFVSGFKSKFESARLRLTDKTNLLYRFEGDKIRFGGSSESLEINNELLTCDWRTGEDWGKPDYEFKKDEYIEPENIRADIEQRAGEENITMRCNINILADDIIKFAFVNRDEDDGSYFVMMNIDTDVANKDKASVKMLTKANGTSGDCHWKKSGGDDTEDTGLFITFNLWSNGLFRTYSVNERWKGNIAVFSGEAYSETTVYYSYSDYDCDMKPHLEMLEEAKKKVEK